MKFGPCLGCGFLVSLILEMQKKLAIEYQVIFFRLERYSGSGK